MDEMTRQKLLEELMRAQDPEGYLATAPESAPQAQQGIADFVMSGPMAMHNFMRMDPSGFNSASPMERQAYDQAGIEAGMAGAGMATAGSAVPPTALGQGAAPGRMRGLLDALAKPFQRTKATDADIMRAMRDRAAAERREIEQGLRSGAYAPGPAAKRMQELNAEIAEMEAAFRQPVSASGASAQPASVAAQPPAQQLAGPQVGQQVAKPNPKPRKSPQTSQSNLPSGDPNILPGSASEQMKVLEKLIAGSDPKKLPSKQKKIYNYLLDVSRETGTPFNKLLSAMKSGKKLGKWAAPGAVAGSVETDVDALLNALEGR